MRILKGLLMGALLALSAVSTAHAGQKVMATAPASRFYPNSSQRIDCTILNVDKRLQTVDVQLMDYSGNLVGDSGSIDLSPGTAWTLGDSTDATSWCRFTVTGSAKIFRAAAVYSVSNKYVASSLAR